MSSSYDHSTAGWRAEILPGAAAELARRGWDRIDNPHRVGQAGTVAFRYGAGTAQEQIAVTFDDGETIGFPPDFVRMTHPKATR
jgi:hypothetical protein